jgi:hypothetical protein
VSTYYKVLDADQRSMHGGTGKWTVGRWRSVRGDLVPCERGLHLCRPQDLLYWIGPVIWEVEVEGEVIEAGDKVVARKARIVRKVEAWNERTARLFAADCAEDVLHLVPEPQRAICADTIAVARRYANGEATKADLTAARAAAGAAAGDAAGARQSARLVGMLGIGL